MHAEVAVAFDSTGQQRDTVSTTVQYGHADGDRRRERQFNVVVLRVSVRVSIVQKPS
jgi:hypothetical protein